MSRRSKNQPLFKWNPLLFLRSQLSSSRLAIPLFIATILGMLTGLVMVGFVRGIDFFEHFFFTIVLNRLTAIGGPYGIVAIPVLGALVVGLLVTFLAPEAKGHGVPEVMKALALRGGRIRPLAVLTKAVASILSIGSGASVGREGPAVQIGAGIGSFFGSLFRVSESRVKNLVACGAAAGISAVFNAPITGVMFALEILLKDFGARALSTVVVASVAASIVSRIFLGESPAFLVPHYVLWSPYEMFLYLALGILSAFTALLFIAALDRFDSLWERFAIPHWLKPATGAIVLGLMGLFYPEVFGMGFTIIEKTLRGELASGLLIGLVFIKIIATSVSLGSGSSGGTFAPTLFVGAALGGGLGHLFYGLMPFPTAPPGAYALVGMASVFAGAFHAPVTAILLVFEMTGDYRMILPIMGASVVSAAISQLFSRVSIDTVKLKRQGIDLESFEEAKILGAIQVRDAMSKEYATVPRNCSVKDLAERMAKEKTKSFYVVNSRGELAGAILPERIQEVLFEKDLALFVADDLAVPCSETCHPDDSLTEVAHHMMRQRLVQIPVMDPHQMNQIVGTLKSENVFKTYTEMSTKRADLVNRLEQETASASGTIQIHFNLPEKSALIGCYIRDLGIPHGVVLTSIRRKKKIIVPEGNTQLKAKDEVWAVVIPDSEQAFRAWLLSQQLTTYSFFQ